MRTEYFSKKNWFRGRIGTKFDRHKSQMVGILTSSNAIMTRTFVGDACVATIISLWVLEMHIAHMDILILIRLSSLAQHCIHDYSVQCIGKTVNVKCEPTTANQEKGKKCCCNIRTSYLYIYYAYLRDENGKNAPAAATTAACVGETVISLI